MIMNDELESMFKELVVASFEELPQHFYEGAERE
jgi:hypothetical protein